MIARLIDSITSLILSRPRLIVAVCLFLMAISVALATRLRIDPDVLNLVPRHNREVNEFRSVLEETGTLDFHIVVLEFPAGADPEPYGALIDAIGSRLKASPLMDNVTWSVPDPLAVVDKVLPYSLLVLEPEQLDVLAQKLSDEGIREAVERNRTLLQTPQSTMVKQLIRVDPFHLLPLYAEKFEHAGGGLNVDLSTGYYVSRDRTAAVLIARPKRAAQDLPFSRRVMDETEALVNEAVAEFRAANVQTPLPSIGYTGGYAIAAGDEKIIRRDMTLNSITSMAGVLLIYFLAYRRPSALFYAAAPMVAAIVITFGIGALVFGTLSAASTGFAALLAGLGIDFMTVLYERYVDERNRGASIVAAIRTCMSHTLPGVIVGALTTAATFYAFLATEFGGMRELGFLTGTGILVFMFCVIFLFPALLVLLETRRDARRTVRVRSVGTRPFVRAALARPRLMMAGWAIVVAVTGVIALDVRFSDQLQNLRSRGNEGFRLQDVVTEKFGQSFEFMMYAVRAKTAAEAIEKTERAMPDLQRIADQGIIGSYQAVSTFLPSEATQRQVIRRLEAGEDGPFNFERIDRTFRQELVRAGFRANAWDDYLGLFQKALAQREPVTMATLETLGLAETVQRFIKKTEDGYMSIVYVYPVTGTWPRFLPEELQQFRRNHPEGILTGVNLVSQTLRTITYADALRASLLGFILVFGLLWAGFRSFARAALVFVPFIAGCTAMLGFMAAADIEFNFMNIFVGLMLVGTATDYAVYMLQRYDEDPGRFHENAHETARAVTLAAMMSIVGFASFAMSHYPGVRSLGYASAIGIALSCLASITLLPAMLSTGWFRHRKAAMLGEHEPDPVS